MIYILYYSISVPQSPEQISYIYLSNDGSGILALHFPP